VTLVMRYILAK